MESSAVTLMAEVKPPLPVALGTGPLQHMQGPPSSCGVITRWELVV